MATMELTDSEVGLIARARQTPEERAADNAARRAAQEAKMLDRMSVAEREAYAAKKAAVEKLTAPQRIAFQFLELKATAETQLKKPDIAKEVAAVTVVIDGLKPKLQAQPENLLRAPAKKGR